MNESVTAGLVAGAIAVTAGGGICIAAEGWPRITLAALAGAFGRGARTAERNTAAFVASSGRSAKRWPAPSSSRDTVPGRVTPAAHLYSQKHFERYI